jgi:hypothetical protein
VCECHGSTSETLPIHQRVWQPIEEVRAVRRCRGRGGPGFRSMGLAEPKGRSPAIPGPEVESSEIRLKVWRAGAKADCLKEEIRRSNVELRSFEQSPRLNAERRGCESPNRRNSERRIAEAPKSPKLRGQGLGIVRKGRLQGIRGLDIEVRSFEVTAGG